LDRKPNKQPDRVREQSWTYDMYASLPEDGNRYEVLDGVLELMSPGPSASHQTVNRELLFILMQSCRSDYILFSAPLDVILSDTVVVQPDLVMIHRSREQIVTERGIEGAPDLVVEIVNPGSRKRDKVVKLALYARHGVPEYWVIDPVSRTLEQYKPGEGGVYRLHNLFERDDTVVSDHVPCISFALRELFADMPSSKGEA